MYGGADVRLPPPAKPANQMGQICGSDRVESEAHAVELVATSGTFGPESRDRLASKGRAKQGGDLNAVPVLGYSHPQHLMAHNAIVIHLDDGSKAPWCSLPLPTLSCTEEKRRQKNRRGFL